MRYTQSTVLIATGILLLESSAWGFSSYRASFLPAKTRCTSLDFCSTNNLFHSVDRLSSREQQEETLLNNRHSASDWLYNIRSLPQSRVLQEVRNPVLAVTGWSFVVSLIYTLCSNSAVPLLQKVATKLTIPGTAHSFLVSALGLLLVFRTNSSYQRFNEGRKIWEHILSVSRNFSRLIELYSEEVGQQTKKQILNLVAAYPYLLRHHIRPGCLCEDKPKSIKKRNRLRLTEPALAAIETRYEGDKSSGGTTDSSKVWSVASRYCWVDRTKLPWSLFDQHSTEHIAVTHNRPLWVCDKIGKKIMKIPYGPNFTSRERLAMLGHVEKLTNAIGQCERIHQTAVPLNYARHSLRSLTLWLFTLPFALVKDLGLLTSLVCGCTAWLMFGVYQIGYSIEDPFQGSLRLSILCDAIRRDVIGDSVGDRDSAFEEGKDTSLPNAMKNADDFEKVGKQLLEDNLTQELLLTSSPNFINETWDSVRFVESSTTGRP